MIFFNQAKYIKECVCRVIIHNVGNSLFVGSGFFIKKNLFLTCFHVVFSSELKNLRKNPQFILLTEPNEHAKLKEFFRKTVIKIEIELTDGQRVEANLKDFDEKYDVALLEINPNSHKIKVCHLEFNPRLTIGSYLSFGGFPVHYDYPIDKAPFAFNEGVLSTLVNTTIGGDKYEHLQLNSINLGGNSGGPLFFKNSWKIIGIINGNMNWGRDDLALVTPNGIVSGSLRTPLSIAYATPLKMLKEKSNILNMC